MIDILDPGFSLKVDILLKNCNIRNIVMVPYEKLRTPFVQAKYWSHGRSNEEIKQAIDKLEKEKAFFLATCLEQHAQISNVKPVITNALPGCSWHQWGEAIDCCWVYNGVKTWDTDLIDTGCNGNGYEVYATEAKKLGLDAGFFWTTIKDATHVQYQSYGSPLDIYSYSEIDIIMNEYYNRKI